GMGPAVVRGLLHFGERMTGRRGNLLHLVERALMIVRRLETEQRAVADDGQRLAQAVVELGGDALSLTLLRFDQPAREALLRTAGAGQRLNPPLVDREDRRGGRGDEQTRKPPRPVERGDDAQSDGGAGGIPDPFRV